MLRAIARSRGRLVIHISSPSIARVAHALSSLGSGNTMGLAISHTRTMAPTLQLRVQMGTKTRGTLSRRVQALQGLEWYLKTSLRSRLLNDPPFPPSTRVSIFVRNQSDCLKGNSRNSAYSIVHRTPPQNRKARSLAHPLGGARVAARVAPLEESSLWRFGRRSRNAI